MTYRKEKNQDIDDDYTIFTPYITRNGKRIWHPTGGVFKFKGKHPRQQ